MLGYPKYQIGQIVTFKIDMYNRGKQETETLKKEGTIAIIDKYGTFEDDSDVSYDILVTDENCLYKHIREDFINK